jgi:hypothetical protein
VEPRQEIVPVQLANGVKMHVEATVLGDEEEVAFKVFSFKEVTDTIESIAESVIAAMEKVKPKKAGVPLRKGRCRYLGAAPTGRGITVDPGMGRLGLQWRPRMACLAHGTRPGHAGLDG